VGKISLPSSILQFWDLGGQRGIRSIWHRYYDDCHAVAYVIDADDRERLSEGWEVFGMPLPSHSHILTPLIKPRKDSKTLSCPPLKFLAFPYCSLRTNRIAHRACQSRKSDMIMRSGIKPKWRAPGDGTERMVTWIRGGRGLLAWTLWAFPLCRGM
jgi:ADP-ribosylation factor family